MKISLAQIRSAKGDILENIKIHEKWIELAIAEKSDLIVFPELSLIGYEPEISGQLAMDPNDARLTPIQRMCDQHDIIVGCGAPILSEEGVHISMLIFRPSHDVISYAKQLLHSDEYPYFVEGKHQVLVDQKGEKVAPAICYESMHEAHSTKAVEMGASVYLASVAKDQKGVEGAFQHYPRVAKKHSMPVLMSNSVGYYANFLSAGCSGVWGKQGRLLASLNETDEGLLTFDTTSEFVTRK